MQEIRGLARFSRDVGYRRSHPLTSNGPHSSVRVPYVRTSVRGPKTMGEAHHSFLFRIPRVPISKRRNTLSGLGSTRRAVLRSQPKCSFQKQLDISAPRLGAHRHDCNPLSSPAPQHRPSLHHASRRRRGTRRTPHPPARGSNVTADAGIDLLQSKDPLSLEGAIRTPVTPGKANLHLQWQKKFYHQTSLDSRG
jgi:hypothetical protein